MNICFSCGRYVLFNDSNQAIPNTFIGNGCAGSTSFTNPVVFADGLFPPNIGAFGNSSVTNYATSGYSYIIPTAGTVSNFNINVYYNGDIYTPTSLTIRLLYLEPGSETLEFQETGISAVFDVTASGVTSNTGPDDYSTLTLTSTSDATFALPTAYCQLLLQVVHGLESYTNGVLSVTASVTVTP